METETSAAISVPHELTIDVLLDIGWPEHIRRPRTAMRIEAVVDGLCKAVG